MSSAIDRDLSKLHPEFRELVELLLKRLRARGLDPMVWEAWRSFERAEEMQKRGSGVAMSMHCYGLAVDIISATTRWNAPSEFWAALGDEAETLGLVWGGRWQRKDLPHVQAVLVRDQDRVRAMSDTERSAFVSEHLAGVDPSRKDTVRDVRSRKP